MSKSEEWPGYAFFEPGQELLELIVVSEDVRKSVLRPTEEDIRRACVEHDLDFEYTMSMVRTKKSDVHTMIIEVEKYREYLSKLKGVV